MLIQKEVDAVLQDRVIIPNFQDSRQSVAKPTTQKKRDHATQFHIIRKTVNTLPYRVASITVPGRGCM